MDGLNIKVSTTGEKQARWTAMMIAFCLRVNIFKLFMVVFTVKQYEWLRSDDKGAEVNGSLFMQPPS